MLDIDIQVKRGNKAVWRTSKLVPSKALENIGRFAAALVSERVIKTTKDAYGIKYPPYKKRKQGKKSRFFWVTKDFRQPNRNRLDYKKETGQVAYNDRGAYEEALGGGRSRKDKRFAMSGGMWQGLTIKMVSPGHVSVSFTKASKAYGTIEKDSTSANTKSNTQKAKLSARVAGKHILEFSDKEVDTIAKLIFAMSEMNAFEGLLEEAKVFEVHKKTEAIRAKLSAVKREIAKLRSL